MTIRITNLNIETFIQMTEEKKSVERAVLNCIKGEERGDFSFTEIKGHFGNKIILLNFKSKTPQKAFKSLIKQLNQNIPIENLLEDNLSKNKIYFRLDKQSAFSGNLITSRGNDIIKIKVSISGNIDEISEYFKVITEDPL